MIQTRRTSKMWRAHTVIFRHRSQNGARKTAHKQYWENTPVRTTGGKLSFRLFRRAFIQVLLRECLRRNVVTAGLQTIIIRLQRTTMKQAVMISYSSEVIFLSICSVESKNISESVKMKLFVHHLNGSSLEIRPAGLKLPILLHFTLNRNSVNPN